MSTVAINGLNFLDCSGNLLEFVDRFHLIDSTFYDHPEADGTTLTIADSTAYLERIAFLSSIESAPDLIDVLQPQEKENCNPSSTTDIKKILTNNSVVIITQGLFDSSIWGLGAVIYSCGSSEITIFNSTFKNNSATCCSTQPIICDGAILRIFQSSLDVRDCRFEHNEGFLSVTIGGDVSFTHSTFSHHYSIHNIIIAAVIMVYSNLSISYSIFINNTIISVVEGYSSVISIDHSKFLNNSGNYLIVIFPKKATITLNEFVSNRIMSALVFLRYYTLPGTIIDNIFINNSALYDILINSDCEPGLSVYLGSSRCIECPEHWYRNLVGLLVAAFVAGILLVIFMLALNLTVAVGTLNGILFYANIVASNTDAYFPLSSAPNVVSVFISWLNLDFGFDICVYEGMTVEAKALLQLAFPAYVILLVAVIIIVSEYSSKFARIVGKGNPVAVLATMILVSYTNL
ncbi:MAG: right-handed parallel beta-helix repeat-containing protein, partial [Proteobacteria bacterium]|nr:right-handed parallel beta-helix repeat-containing protein [Pseudomonadota bacterium]